MNTLSAEWSTFTSSLGRWLEGLSFHTVFMAIMAAFMLVGLIDKLRGNRKGYGAAFDAAFATMGPLALAMVGAIALAPVLGQWLSPVVAPIYKAMGASPALFVPTFLAGDMGGYSLAMAMAEGDEALGNFGGLLVSMTLGGTVIFTIPFALTVIKKEDRPVFAVGTLAGVAVIPVGVLVGGLLMPAAGFDLPLSTLLINMVPVLIPALLVAVGLWLKPDWMMKFFSGLGKVITVVILAALGLAIFQQLTGVRLPFLRMMAEPDASGHTPLDQGLLAVGQIAIVLAGALPMMEVLKKVLRKPLASLERRGVLDKAAAAGLMASLANSIAMFNTYGEMNTKGKLLNAAFAVSAAFMLGDHLGFAAANSPAMILPMIAAKAVGGAGALVLAGLVGPKLLARTGGASDTKGEP